MTEQISFLASAEATAFNIIKPALISVLKENGLDENTLSYDERKSYHSVRFNASVVVRITSAPTPSLSIPTQVLMLTPYANYADTDHKDYTKISIPSLDAIGQYTEMLQAVLQKIIDRVPKEFDCCSRYLECSNVKNCVHPDKSIALGCGYRKQLKSGKIFYGENRNID